VAFKTLIININSREYYKSVYNMVLMGVIRSKQDFVIFLLKNKMTPLRYLDTQ